MELNKHICTQLEEKARAFAQITLDDDYIVRDNKPDAIRIIHTKGDVLVEDTKVGNQVLWITGKLHFTTLYQSDDENHRLESVSGEIPFQEKLVMDEAQDGDEIAVTIHIEDLSAGIINSRKIALRAVLNILAIHREETNLAITCAMTEGEHREQKKQKVCMMCLVENKKDIVRMQKELLLPNSRSNIAEIIFSQVDFRKEEIVLQEDRVQVQMDAQVCVLYRSETTGEYECFETVVPLQGEVECGRLQGDEIFWAKLQPAAIEIEPRGDYDGEARMIGMELTLSVEMQIYREEECEILEDAYALDQELVMEREKVLFSQLLVKNSSKIRLLEQHRLEANQERILQICGSSGNITLDRVEKKREWCVC